MHRIKNIMCMNYLCMFTDLTCMCSDDYDENMHRLKTPIFIFIEVVLGSLRLSLVY